MSWRFLIAWRYFKARRKEKFISVISLISVIGVAVGVAALITVIAVMSGFDYELKSKIIGTTPHLFIEKEGGMPYPNPAVEAELRGNKEIVGFSPFVTGQTIIKKDDSFTGVYLTGIDEEAEKSVTNIRQYMQTASPSLTRNGAFVGSELARELRLGIGDTVSIVSASAAEPHEATITGIFHTGLYTFDIENIFVNLETAQRIFDIKGLVTGMEVNITDELRADTIKKELNTKLGFPYYAKSWIDLHKNLFSALMLEKLVMFAVVALVVVVACFNIASTLIMRVIEKTKDIGILRALGAKAGDIKAIFRLEGFFIGGIGTVLGIAAGYLLTWIQMSYQIVKLPRDVYYIDALPMRTSWYEYTVIAVAAILLSLISTLYPSRQAARLEVVDALRYE